MQSNYFDCRLALSLTLLCGSLIAFGGCTSELNSAHPDANASTEGHVIISSSEMNAILTSNPRGQFYYVSVQGTRRGNGSQSNPWNLSTVCSGNPGFGFPPPPSAIQPGDTIYVRGGTYTGTFRCYLNGTSAAPIILRAYPGERAIIDNPSIVGGSSAVDWPLWLEGNYLWAIGLEVQDSNPLRTGTQKGRIVTDIVTNNTTTVTSATANCTSADVGTGLSLPNDFNSKIVSCSGNAIVLASNPGTTATRQTGSFHYARPIGVVITGAGSKLINSVVHDAGVGVFPGTPNVGGEVYGSLIYNNGWLDGGDFGSTGYAMYSQNATGTKLFKDNFFFNNFGYSVQIFSQSSGATLLKGFNFIGNTWFGAGKPTNTLRDALIFGGYDTAVVEGGVLDSNYFYAPGQCCAAILGYQSDINKDISFTNNVLVGTDIQLRGFQNVTWRNNTIVFNAVGTGNLEAIFPATYNIANYNVGQNAYFCPDGNCLPSNWTSQGLDSKSTISRSPISGPASVYVRRNVYDPNRTHIIIYNWRGSSIVSIDMSSVLTVGAEYELRNVQDYFGSPVLTGVYNGQPLQVPMSGLNVAAPIGGKAPAPTGPDFNAFILIKR